MVWLPFSCCRMRAMQITYCKHALMYSVERKSAKVERRNECDVMLCNDWLSCGLRCNGHAQPDEIKRRDVHRLLTWSLLRVETSEQIRKINFGTLFADHDYRKPFQKLYCKVTVMKINKTSRNQCSKHCWCLLANIQIANTSFNVCNLDVCE